jgi:PAS domain S-box-containing protein
MDEDKFATLRQQAEEILRGQPANLADLSTTDMQALIHNLQVHQIELELQNEELRRTQLELQAARDRYADLYNFAPVGYFTLDANGVIVEANLTGAALLNVTRSALVGTPLTHFVVPEDREKYAIYRVELGNSETLQTTELRLIRQAEAPFFARLEGLAWHDQAGRLFQCKLTVSDISERVRAEAALRRASRLEVAATLAGGIAHDINNLMTTVLGNADLLSLNLNTPDAPDMLTAISRSAQRASELAQQMLAFARGGKYHPRRMNLNDTLQEALQHQQDAAPGPSLVIERQLGADLWPVLADASQMSQVMDNLLSNAVEAGDGRGRIRVSTGNLVIDEAGMAEQPHNLNPGRYVKLTVEDEGCGMNAEVLARVFEPFFSTKFQGRGMGMAAVYGIVQNHGGDIFIKSEAGLGTVFTVYLPAVEVEVKPAAKSKETLIVIDDEEIIRTMLQRFLESFGYQVLAAQTGLEGLEIAQTFAGEIHLALLDMEMPHLNGRQTLARLKQLRPKLKVILFSDYSLKTDTQALLAAGADAFIQKPFKMDALAAEIRRVLDM